MMNKAAELELEPTRKVRQLQIIKRWYTNHGVGTAQCVTGFGKTTLTLLAISRYRKGVNQKTSKILVVVPTLHLKHQWNNKLKEWELLDSVEIWTIQSLMNIEDKITCSFLVADEIHMYAAQQFRKLFDCVRYNQILGLTATLPKGDPKYDIINEKCPIIDTVSLREAVDNDWVSDFVIYNLGFDLTEDQREKYKKYSSIISKYLPYFNNDLSIMFKCIKNKVYRNKRANALRNAGILDVSGGKLFGIAKKCNDAIRGRKDMLYNLPQKITLAKEVIDTFSDKLCITFSMSIASANKLSEELGDISLPYHSKVNSILVENLFGDKITRKVNKNNIRNFIIGKFSDSNDKVRVLCTAKALDMGADIPTIDLGIILSGSSKSLQALQRAGRVLRFQENKIAFIIEIYAKKTQDRKWLVSRQRQVPRRNIKWIKNVQEII